MSPNWPGALAPARAAQVPAVGARAVPARVAYGDGVVPCVAALCAKRDERAVVVQGVPRAVEAWVDREAAAQAVHPPVGAIRVRTVLLDRIGSAYA